MAAGSVIYYGCHVCHSVDTCMRASCALWVSTCAASCSGGYYQKISVNIRKPLDFSEIVVYNMYIQVYILRKEWFLW